MEPNERLEILGRAELLEQDLLGLFCSRKCPGDIILKTFDLAKDLRERGVAVASGFHSSMEKECLRILLRGEQPIVWFLARGMLKRVPPPVRQAIDEGRMTIVTPFPEATSRISSETAKQRNQLIARMSAALFIAHASPGSRTEHFCNEMIAAGHKVYTFAVQDNEALLQSGAMSIDQLGKKYF